MFALEDLRKTRSFQQAVTEGRRQGLQEGRQPANCCCTRSKGASAPWPSAYGNKFRL